MEKCDTNILFSIDLKFRSVILSATSTKTVTKIFTSTDLTFYFSICHNSKNMEFFNSIPSHMVSFYYTAKYLSENGRNPKMISSRQRLNFERFRPAG